MYIVFIFTKLGGTDTEGRRGTLPVELRAELIPL
jgi:hypothetical protein